MIKIGKLKIIGWHLIYQPMYPNIDYLEIASAYKAANELASLRDRQCFFQVFYPVRNSSQSLIEANPNVSHVTEITNDVVKVVNFMVINPIETTEICISILSEYYESVKSIYDKDKASVQSYSNRPDPFWIYSRSYEPPYRFKHIPEWIKHLKSLIQ